MRDLATVAQLTILPATAAREIERIKAEKTAAREQKDDLTVEKGTTQAQLDKSNEDVSYYKAQLDNARAALDPSESGDPSCSNTGDEH